MKCKNSQFGEFAYTDEHVYVFPAGLIGFERLTKFILVHDAETEPFRWLISLEDEDVALPVIDPSLVVIDHADLYDFGSESTVAVVAALREPLEESTVNLRSPLVFEVTKRTGQQVILPDERISIHHKFITEPQLVTGE